MLSIIFILISKIAIFINDHVLKFLVIRLSDYPIIRYPCFLPCQPSANCKPVRAKNSKERFVSLGKLKKSSDKTAVMRKEKILRERKKKLAVCNDENSTASDDDDASKTASKRPKRQQTV